ncbi:MAG: C25 family cysteine peptidase, partial [Nitrospirota bacterium]
VWAASSIGYPSEHDPLAQSLYNIVFNQDVTLGEAVTKAKVDAYTNPDLNKRIPEDVVQTFIFFGDPATRLK